MQVASRNSPNMEATFFMDDPPEGHHDAKQRKPSYLL